MVLLLGVPLLLVAAWLVAYGTTQTARSTANGFLSWLGSTFLATTALGAWVALHLTNLASWLSHELGSWAESATERLANWFGGLAAAAETLSYWSYAWPYELLKFGGRLIDHTVPRQIRALPNSLTVPFRKLALTVKADGVQLARLGARVGTLAVAIADVAESKPARVAGEKTLDWIRSHWKALAAAAAAPATVIPRVIVHDLPVPWGRTVAQIKKRLSRLERYLTPETAAAAIVSAGLVALRLSWVKCRNVGKVGKALCGFPSQLLEDLLAGTLDVLLVSDLCQIVYLMTDAAKQFEPYLVDFVNVSDALIGCHGVTKPGTLAPPVPQLIADPSGLPATLDSKNAAVPLYLAA